MVASIPEVLHVTAAMLFLGYIKATVIQTKNGRIRGYTETILDTEVDIYLGIPFAKPPLGDLRFRSPLPVDNWDGILDVQSQPNSCMQLKDSLLPGFEGVEMWNTKTNITEDCLYLNVIVPRVPSGTQLTTMLWIFGGSFTYGSITLDVYDGRYLAAKQQVIYAAMQYRMGVHGFLYTGTDDAPGNAGLLDQRMAMKWIYDNIESFGGDKSKICLFGESAGSASVGLHLLAPDSWPYFSSAIMQSSSPLSEWATAQPSFLLNKTMDLAQLLGCPTSTSTQMMQCLRNVDASVLETKQYDLPFNYIGLFVPTIDGVVLPDSPETLVRTGRVKACNVLIGTTKDEGSYFLPYWFADYFPASSLWNQKPLSNQNFSAVVSEFTGLPDSIMKDVVLYQYYNSNIPSLRGSYIDALDSITGDLTFKCPIINYAQAFTSLNPNRGSLYMYSFHYRTSANPWPRWMGIMHGYEIDIVFGLPFNHDLNYTQTDKDVSERVMSFWTNFAKLGNPGQSWPPYTADTQTYMILDSGSQETSQGLRFAECELWNNLIPKLRRAYDEGKIVSTASSTSASPAAVTLLALALFASGFAPHQYAI